MTRTGLFVALAIAVAVGVMFGLYPELDLAVSRPFFEMMEREHKFALRLNPTVLALRETGLWVVTLLVVPAVIAVPLKFLFPNRRMPVPGRAAIFLMATLALGPGLLTNLILKEHWDRSRPIDVTVFQGSERFVPWWDRRGECLTNCSFVSGDVSGAFWTLAPAALAPPAWRAWAYGGALALGFGMAVLRIAAGGHFFTDAAFAGVFTFLVIWIVYAVIYRRMRWTDEGIERTVERHRRRVQDFILRLLGRKRAGP